MAFTEPIRGRMQLNTHSPVYSFRPHNEIKQTHVNIQPDRNSPVATRVAKLSGHRQKKRMAEKGEDTVEVRAATMFVAKHPKKENGWQRRTRVV
mgnify:CR=1 FL=1